MECATQYWKHLSSFEGKIMDQDRLTEKSLEALQAAQRLAAKLNHQQMDVEHLLLALLDQEHGLAPAIFAKTASPPTPLPKGEGSPIVDEIGRAHV